MRRTVFERIAALPVTAAAVHAALTQAVSRRRLVPLRWVPRLEMQRRSDGSGRLRLDLALDDGDRTLDLRLAEPELGQVLLETSDDGSVARSYVLEPFALGTATRLHSRLELHVADAASTLKRALREIQTIELERLGRLAGEAALARNAIRSPRAHVNERRVPPVLRLV